MVVPVVLLNNSAHMWPIVPFPGEAYATWLGLAFRWATSSATSRAGSPG